MDKNNASWLAPLTGVAGVIVAVVGFIIMGEPPTAKDDPVEEIVNHYVDNDSKVMFGSAISTIGATLLVFFFGYLRKVLRAAEGEGGVLSLVAFGGAVIFALSIAIDSTISFALADTAEDIDPTAVQALQALWDNDFMPFALGSQLILFAMGISIVRHGALPVWLGWIAIVLGVIAVTPIGFVAGIGMGVLVLIISVMLALRARGSGTPAAA